MVPVAGDEIQERGRRTLRKTLAESGEKIATSEFHSRVLFSKQFNLTFLKLSANQILRRAGTKETAESWRKF